MRRILNILKDCNAEMYELHQFYMGLPCPLIVYRAMNMRRSLHKKQVVSEIETFYLIYM